MDEGKPRATGGVPYVSSKERIGTAARDARGRSAGPDPAAEADRVRRAAAKSAGAPPAAGAAAGGPAETARAEIQRAERAKQALLGSLLRDASGNGAQWPVDEARLRDALAAMKPDEAVRLARFLAHIRKAEPPGGGGPDGGPPVLGRVEELLAGRGIRLELRGQTNNIYIAGDNPTWHVERGPESAAPAGGEGRTWKPNRAWSRNSWGYQLGRSVRNFINGH